MVWLGSELFDKRWGVVVGGAIALLLLPGSIPHSASVVAADDIALSPVPVTPLDTANAFFEYRGEPINPRAVIDLLPWLSDSEPGLVAIDVEGSMADTNRYFAEVSVVEDGPATGTVRASWQPWIDRPIVYTSSYRWLGQLDNGLHILRVARNTGGSGVFTSLLFVRFELDTEYFYGVGPGPRQRLSMKRMGSQGLGDRDSREVWLEGNQVVVGAGEQSEEVRIDLSDY
ncbi:MAG: hypothetical protein AAF579_01235 [Cyanobacteria bacterium P01_C01_bin.118]